MNADDTPPLLYGDAQLQPLRLAEPRSAARGLVRELLEASDSAARERRQREALRHIGFDWLGYGTVLRERGRLRSPSFFTSFAHPEWTQHYFAQHYYELDRRHGSAPRSGLPLVWDRASLQRAHEAAGMGLAQRRFLDDMRHCGIGSGVMFCLPSTLPTGEQHVVSLGCAQPDAQWIDDQVIGQALMLGLSVHDYLSRHAPPVAANVDTIEVTALQQVILQQLLQGRGDKEIAYHLQLSLHAVDYHMRQLRRRFAARNRVQLVNAVMNAQQRSA